MKKLFENWRKYSEVKHLRVISNELVPVTEQQLKDFPLSEEELASIKDWGELEGDPVLLGKGTMGEAFQFGEMVLKITSDQNEAQAAAAITGQRHPNVYYVEKVGRRFPAGQRPEEMPNHPYLIVYEMVAGPMNGSELPDQNASGVIQSIGNSRDKIWYNWSESILPLKEQFLEYVRSNEDKVKEMAVQKGKPYKENLERLAELSGMDPKQVRLFVSAWGLSAGFYGYSRTIDSVENIEILAENPNFKHVDELSLGLTFLQQNGITFKDLKNTNVMNDDGKLVIIDIGKSLVMNKEPLEVITEKE